MANNAFGMQCLTDMSTQLKGVDRAFKVSIMKQLRAAVVEASADVSGRVRSNASWSGRIPGAVGVSVRMNPKGASVKLIVNKNAAPHARPLEVGNKTQYSADFINRHGGFKMVNGRRVAVDRKVYKKAQAAGASSRVLVHPVWDYPLSYASRITVQPTRPFFFPAIDASKAGIDSRMEAAMIAMAKEAGFK